MTRKVKNATPSTAVVPTPSKGDKVVFSGAAPLWGQKYTPIEKGTPTWGVALAIVGGMIKDRAAVGVMDPLKEVPYSGGVIECLNVVPFAEKFGIPTQEGRRTLRDAVLTVCNALKEGVRKNLPFQGVYYGESRKWRFADGSPTPLLTQFVELWNGANGDGKVVSASYGVDEFGNPSLPVGSLQAPLKAAIACKMGVFIPPKKSKASGGVDPSLIEGLEAELLD